MARVTWKMKKTADGAYEGWVILPFDMPSLHAAAARARGLPPPRAPRRHPARAAKPVAIKAKGKTPAGALSSAANLADKLISNPIVSSILPPGTGAAVKGIKYISKAAKVGKLGKAVGKLVGPGAKRLGKALMSFF